MALSDILLRAETTFQNVSFYLNKVVIVLVIIFAGFIIGKIIESILRRIFVKVGLDDKLTNIFKARRNYSRAIRRSVVRLIYLCTILYALSKLAVLEEVFAIVVLLVIFAILASWILAGIDVMPNLLARMQLHGRGITVGNEVSVMHNTGMIQGLVVDMTLTDVRVKRKNGDLFFIPNAVFLESVVKRHR